jgi:hypothetical protein
MSKAVETKHKPKTYYAGYDGTKLNLIGMPKVLKLFRTKRMAQESFEIVYPIKIMGPM